MYNILDTIASLGYNDSVEYKFSKMQLKCINEKPFEKEKNSMNRFVKTYSQGTLNVMEIWVDMVTGVNYIYHQAGYSGGLTPLLDSEGKPVVTMVNGKTEQGLLCEKGGN